MGRRVKDKRLAVWMNGELVGWWSLTPQDVHEFRYAESWIASPYKRPISLSMPLQPASEAYKGDAVEYFFENLLPNNFDIRRRIQYRFGTSSTRAFELLEEIGRDCVGAVQLLPPDISPSSVKTINGEPLTAAEVADELRITRSPHLFRRGDDEFRISLAGAQEKTALLFHQGKWNIPHGSTPSTHIFKLPLGVIGRGQIDLSTSVENEWLCSKILTAYGLRCAETEMSQFEDEKTLIVKRFDRRLSSDETWWLRLPQEDMCQARGISPDMKYESEGGPGILSIMKLLLGSRTSLNNRTEFFKTQILFWMLAAIDGHAKNFSIFIEPEGRFSLTPAYDVLSAYPVMGRGSDKLPPEKVRMAMAVHGKNRHYRWQSICARHWIRTAELSGLDDSKSREIVTELAEKTSEVIDTVSAQLPGYFPKEVAESIFNGLKESSDRLSEIN
jgi:serine/threonine-protein kinase HipA